MDRTTATTIGLLVCALCFGCGARAPDHQPAADSPAAGWSRPSAADQPTSSDPQFWINKCRGGDGEVCHNVGNSFSKGRPGLGGSYPQDDAKAAELFAVGCRLRSATSCGALGLAMLDGRGIEKNERGGLELLLRACEVEPAGGWGHCFQAGKAVMTGRGREADDDSAHEIFGRGCRAGDRASCEMLKGYEGTGAPATREPPAGALGYAFGMPMDDAAKSCATNGFKFAKVTDGAECSGSKTPQQFTVRLNSCGGRVCYVMLTSRVEADGDALKQYRDLKAELTSRYGEPSSTQWSVPKPCRYDKTFGDCIADGRAHVDSLWIWDSKIGVSLTLRRFPDGRFTNVIGYRSPESSERSRASGL